MADSLSNAADKLRLSAARLNCITDEAAACVEDVEGFLSQECSVGISAFVRVTSAPEPDEDSQWLEYRRVGSHFRIAVVWCPETDPECETVKPWSDCTRDEKLETIKKLPDLILEIAKKLDKKIAEAEATMKSISHVLGTFTGKED